MAQVEIGPHIMSLHGLMRREDKRDVLDTFAHGLSLADQESMLSKSGQLPDGNPPPPKKRRKAPRGAKGAPGQNGEAGIKGPRGPNGKRGRNGG